MTEMIKVWTSDGSKPPKRKSAMVAVVQRSESKGLAIHASPAHPNCWTVTYTKMGLAAAPPFEQLARARAFMRIADTIADWTKTLPEMMKEKPRLPDIAQSLDALVRGLPEDHLENEITLVGFGTLEELEVELEEVKLETGDELVIAGAAPSDRKVIVPKAKKDEPTPNISEIPIGEVPIGPGETFEVSLRIPRNIKPDHN